ncbi:terminase small subunit [Gluconacetobacter sacchari DSM 12717]|uniref:Terminase small subunit n=2 Tax=Gluconacetobacter sacchari TaxID=92759 RepID=A0A7W4NK51_9PROT|nr:terminase small subunit [Gluconacetobacter sacchari]MBB2159251.1 terminase small subunit [Gluconacetobacter sacchari]GBQ27843.1 terminase small subunit [Gluconacetobacter sacchari DSM 12717]
MAADAGGRDGRRLTERQGRFVAEYLVDLNATRAAMRAGYGAGYARRHAWKLLRSARVRAAIGQAEAALEERTKFSQDRVIAELTRLAFYDVGLIAAHRLNGPEDIATLPVEVRAAVTGWSWDKAGNFTVRLAPRTPSLDLLARHFGLLKDVRQHLDRDGRPADPPALYTVVVR